MTVGFKAATVLLQTHAIKKMVWGHRRVAKQHREITLPGMNMR
jgi:hypothetical protein